MFIQNEHKRVCAYPTIHIFNFYLFIVIKFGFSPLRKIALELIHLNGNNDARWKMSALPRSEIEQTNDYNHSPGECHKDSSWDTLKYDSTIITQQYQLARVKSERWWEGASTSIHTVLWLVCQFVSHGNGWMLFIYSHFHFTLSTLFRWANEYSGVK